MVKLDRRRDGILAVPPPSCTVCRSSFVCRSKIDSWVTRCRWCRTDLERVSSGIISVVTGSIYAVVGGVRGFVVGAVVSVIVQTVIG